MPLLRLLPLLAALALPAAAPARAQAPFSRVAVELGGVLPLDRTSFGDGWETPGGVSGSLAAPFYVGRMRAAVQVLPYASTLDGVTDFLGRHVFLEWTVPVRVVPRLSLEGGGRFGVFQMRFDDQTNEPEKHEQEVAAFVVAGASYRLGPWALHARAAYGTVLLVDPERQIFVDFGASRSFAVPEWIQEVLR